MPQKRPNILFLMSDQHRPDVIGYEGDPVVRTPTLDALAKDAVRFNNCYTPSPICVPARPCIAAGQYPRSCGCTSFADDIAPNSMTFARRFAQYAYNTTVCGKLHHNGADQNQGWTQRIGRDSGISKRYIEGYVAEEGERYPRESQWWDWSKELRRAGVGKSPHQVIDEYAVRGALDYIEEYFTSPFYDKDSSHQPLLLKVSLRLPHYPFFTEHERFTYYLNRVKPMHGEPTFEHPCVTRDWDRIDPSVTEHEARRATAAYYGMIEAMDAMYGQVIEALEHAGENLDEWIILYTTDHGEMMGEHGLWHKFKYFEASARVPLFIRWPKQFEAREVEENVNLVDLFASLCDLVDIPTPEGLDSRSFVPLMRGDANGWENETVSQLDKTTMIKRDHLKYQHFADEGPEILFDLERDPKENENFIEDPTYEKELAYFRERVLEVGHVEEGV